MAGANSADCPEKKGAFNAVGRLKVIIAIVDIETNGRTNLNTISSRHFTT